MALTTPAPLPVDGLRTKAQSNVMLMIVTFGFTALWITAMVRYILPASILSHNTVALLPATPLITISVSIALLFVNLKVYSVYDRFVVRWKSRHTLNTVLIPLVSQYGPEISELHYKHLGEEPRRAERHLFYPFVHPIGGSAARVDLNGQFYRTLTAYWSTQILHLGIFIWLASALALGAARPSEREILFLPIVISIVVLAASHVVAAVCRSKIRSITRQEVHEIWSHHRREIRGMIETYFECEQLPLIHQSLNTAERASPTLLS